MSDIFISYKREDQAMARLLATALERQGWSVWWDPRLVAGEHYDDVIETALQEARCVIVLWSSRSIQSRYVKDESAFALRREKLLPILIENIEVPFRYEGIHTPSLINWDGSDAFPSFITLVEDIALLLGPPPVQTDPAATEAETEALPEAEEKNNSVQDMQQDQEELAAATGSGRFIITGLIIVLTIATGSALFLMKKKIPATVQETALLPTTAAETVLPEPKPDQESKAEAAKEEILKEIETIPPPCDYCPELVSVPPGTFQQGTTGNNESEASERPVHTVSISYTLEAGRYEVTRSQFARFVEETGYKAPGCNSYDGKWAMQPDRNWQNPGFPQEENHPVTCVSWNDARTYTQWLSDRTGQDYRLLSSSEWEYLARAGTETLRFWGDEPDDACNYANVADQRAAKQYNGWQVHNCTDQFVHTAPTGSFQANGLDVYDMAGNVFEWVADCWNKDYQDAPVDGASRTTGNCRLRELRGGSWYSQPRFVRSGFRNRFAPDFRGNTFGFRVARTVSP